MLSLRNSYADYLGIIIFSIGISLLSFLQIYFHEVYHYSIYQSSILLGAATIGQLFGSMLSSQYVAIIDKFLSKRYCSMRLSICLLAFSLSILFILFSLIDNFYIFIVCSFFLGVLLALFLPINMTLLTIETTNETIASITFLRRWMLNLGACIGFSLIGILVDSYYLFYNISAIFFFLGCIEYINLYKGQKQLKISKNNLNNVNLEYLPGSVWLWLFSTFLAYVIFFQTISTYPIFLNDYAHINANDFSRLMIISVVTLLTFQFITPIIEKKISISVLSSFGILLIGIGLALVIIPSYFIVILSVIVWSIGEIFLLGITPIYAKIFAGNDREKNIQYSANYYVVCYLGKILGPIMGSFMYSNLVTHYLVFILFLFLSMLSALCFYYLGVYMEKQNLMPAYP